MKRIHVLLLLLLQKLREGINKKYQKGLNETEKLFLEEEENGL